MQIFFKKDTFTINVSTHGYYVVFTNLLPVGKFSSIGILDEGDIEKLGFEYLLGVDDINIDLRDERLKEACYKFLEEHWEEFKKREKEELEKWQEMQGKKIEGENVRIGDWIKLEGRKGRFKLLEWDKKRDYMSVQTEEGEVWQVLNPNELQVEKAE